MYSQFMLICKSLVLNILLYLSCYCSDGYHTKVPYIYLWSPSNKIQTSNEEAKQASMRCSFCSALSRHGTNFEATGFMFKYLAKLASHEPTDIVHYSESTRLSFQTNLPTSSIISWRQRTSGGWITFHESRHSLNLRNHLNTLPRVIIFPPKVSFITSYVSLPVFLSLKLNFM